MPPAPHHHPVLTLLRERIASGSLPGQRADGCKLGLAIEGGGMRAVVSCGMAAEVARLAGYDAFDAVYGTSGGALIGSYFVAREMHLGPSIMVDDLPNPRFINWRRALRRHPVMSLSYLLDEVLMKIKPLPWERAIASPVPLKIVAASLKHGRSRLLSEFNSHADLFAALRATSTIPYIAGPPVHYQGDLLFDGALFEPLPFESALGDGCTHVLVLTSRPKGTHRRPPSLLERRLIEPRLRRESAAAADAFLTAETRYRDIIRHLEHKTDHPDGGPHLCGLHLAATSKAIGRLEKERKRLQAGVEAGAQVVRQALRPAT